MSSAVRWVLAGSVALLLIGSPFIALAASQGVAIRNFVYQPGSVTVNVNDTVTWTNEDAAAHTATSTTGAFTTGTLAQGQSRQVVFTAAGTYPYICSIHGASMSGSVTVLAAATAPPTTAPTTAPTVRPPATASPSPSPSFSASPSPSPSASPTPSPSPSPSSSSSPNATPTAAPGAGPGPGTLLAAGAVAAALGLVGVAIYLFRRGAA